MPSPQTVTETLKIQSRNAFIKLYVCKLQCESLQQELESLKEKVEELTLDLEIIRSEIDNQGTRSSLLPPGSPGALQSHLVAKNSTIVAKSNKSHKKSSLDRHLSIKSVRWADEVGGHLTMIHDRSCDQDRCADWMEKSHGVGGGHNWTEDVDHFCRSACMWFNFVCNVMFLTFLIWFLNTSLKSYPI